MDQHQQPSQENPYRDKNEQPQGMTPVTGEPHDEGPLKHSGLGIASFVIGIVSIIGIIAVIFLVAASISTYLLPNNTIAPGFETDPVVIISSLSILAVLFLSFVGLVLGIIGLVIKRRRKVFSIIGVVLNGLLLLGFAFLLITAPLLQGV
ncbi:hypothetical protein DNH61_17880 [Paenibacillus sambharensis]|uniref:DUF4064 domain-containing protein n=1 Tax=Paenibacillus sambharensis TaxID=1803190 RepID=A0A2W1L5S0_9BACL|nr:hypothetical protein [Paenibacillus sambharensis]PZD94283.1 hypothetical protein DNH61_17880 [Paenibacillus sambharensis]